MSSTTLQKNIRSLPTIREIIETHQLRADKRLGQNFLFDTNITDKIVRLAGDLSKNTVLEVGPGTGILTRSILYYGASQTIAIEKDPRCIPIISTLCELPNSNLTLIIGDALALSNQNIGAERSIKVIANLPYNIGTELLFRWYENIELFSSFTVMLQKEVAQRITAQSGSKNFGYLSILSQILCEANIVMTLPPESFIPAPKVESCVVHLKKRSQPLYEVDYLSLKKVCHALFGQRRKMIRASLKQLTDSPIDVCETLNIDPTARPETLSIQDFCALTKQLQQTP